MPVTFKAATFNVENLFDRPKVFMETNPADGDAMMKDIAALQKEINKATYDKAKILALYKKVKDYIDLFEIRDEKLLNTKKTKVVASGRGEWVGWFRFKRTKFSDQTVKNTAQVVKDVPCWIGSAPRGCGGPRAERSNGSTNPTCASSFTFAFAPSQRNHPRPNRSSRRSAKRKLL